MRACPCAPPNHAARPMEFQETIPFVIGHRGACRHAPENTLPSIRKAAELGVDWVEVDIKLSADGVPFLMHDNDLQRTADGEGATSGLKWAELATLDAGSWFDPAFAGTSLLRLDTLIGHPERMDLGLNVEIKPYPGNERETAEAVPRLLDRCWPAHLPRPLISSFDEACVELAHRMLPEAGRALLFDAFPDDWLDRCKVTNAHAVHLWYEIASPEVIETVIAAGYPTRVFTVNRRVRAVELHRCGVVGVFCDFPERMAAIDMERPLEQS